MIIRFLAVAALFGLLLAIPATAQTYNPLPWQEIDRHDPRIATFYPEADSVAGMKLPREPRIYVAEIDHPMGSLTLAMWVGPEFCGINNCGLKIFDAEGSHLGGANVCDDPGYITIDPSHQFVRLCSDMARAVSDLLWNYRPPVARETVTIWQQDEIYLNHNGSVMVASPSEGTIRYERVRDGLRGIIADGTVLFRGEPWQPGGPFSGTAYTFRKGCEPAPYQVTASYEGYSEVLTLIGEAPVRAQEGCAVVGHTRDSSNAVLEFHTTFD